MSRDYAAEMRAVMDAETGDGSYSAPLLAVKLVEMLEATDPDLLQGWLDSQKVNFIRDALNKRDASVRTHNRLVSSRSVFRQAAGEAASGDYESLTTNFLGERYVVEDGSKVPFRDMGRPERRFVADDYARRASENTLREAFIRAVDRKAGNRRTGEVFNEEKLAELWLSIGGAS